MATNIVSPKNTYSILFNIVHCANRPDINNKNDNYNSNRNNNYSKNDGDNRYNSENRNNKYNNGNNKFQNNRNNNFNNGNNNHDRRNNGENGFNKNYNNKFQKNGFNNKNDFNNRNDFNKNGAKRPLDEKGIDKNIKDIMSTEIVEKESQRDYNSRSIDKEKQIKFEENKANKKNQKNKKSGRFDEFDGGKLKDLKQVNKLSHMFDEQDGGMLDYYDLTTERGKRNKKKINKNDEQRNKQKIFELKEITIPEKITVKDLATELKKTSSEVIKKLFGLGVMATLNNTISFENAEILVLDYNKDFPFIDYIVSLNGGVVYDVLKDNDLNDYTKKALIKDFDSVLSLDLLVEDKNGLDKELEDFIYTKIEERNMAKKNKDYSLADQIRDELLSQGIRLIDTREGTSYEIVRN